jgi:hypothetical protein
MIAYPGDFFREFSLLSLTYVLRGFQIIFFMVAWLSCRKIGVARLVEMKLPL